MDNQIQVSFRKLEPISDGEVADLVETVSEHVIRHLQKKGHLSENSEVVENPLGDDIFRENTAVAEATASSIAGKIAFGPNAGKYVTRIGSGFGYFEEIPLAKGRRCFSINGFSVLGLKPSASRDRQATGLSRMSLKICEHRNKHRGPRPLGKSDQVYCQRPIFQRSHRNYVGKKSSAKTESRVPGRHHAPSAQFRGIH